MNKRVSAEDVQRGLDATHGQGVVLLDKSSFLKAYKKATFIDKDFGSWEALPAHVLKFNRRHPKFGRAARDASYVIPVTEVQARLDSIHGQGIVTLVTSTYRGTSEKATFIDKDFGQWQGVPSAVLHRNGRHPNFGHASSASSHVIPAEDVQKRLDLIHGQGVVTLDISSYLGVNKKATFIDKDYGSWTTTPNGIFSASSCHRHPKFGRASGTATRVKHTTPDGMSIAELCKKVGIESTSGFTKMSRAYSPEYTKAFINSNLDENGKFVNRISSLETVFINNFKTLLPGLTLWNKKPLEDKNISFFPDFRLTVGSKVLYAEAHGLFIHSNGFKKGAAAKDKKYHFNKGTSFRNANLNYVQFFEDEINFKFPIVESIIKSRLGLITTSYFARKLVLKPIVDQPLVKQFLNDNHLMGYKANKAVGLFDSDKLVCLMTYAEYKGKVTIERFCTLLNTKCPGGFGKLVAWLKKFRKPIHSFCDLRYGNGHSYEALGFKNIGETIGFSWTDGTARFNRLYCTALKGKTQKENAIDMKLFKIYDAGQRKYVLA